MVAEEVLTRSAAPSAPAPKVIDKRVAALKRFAISITVFNIVGRLWLGFETSWASLCVALLTAYTAELFFEFVDAKASGRRPRYEGGLRSFVIFLLPGHIGAVAISMLLYPGGELWPFVFAVTVASAGKYLFQAPVNGKLRHVLNPSNLGISATLLVFPWVGVGLPYQFTETTSGIVDWIIPLALFASGIMLNSKLTGKMPLVLSWLGFFALQAVLRGLDPTVSLVGALAPMTGLAFLLFTTYMITDPGSTPVRPLNQVAFGAACAACYAGFMLLHIAYGIFYSVVVVCAIRGGYLWFRHWRGIRTQRAQASVPEAGQQLSAPTGTAVPAMTLSE
ncbi:hypothetical protein DFJ67_4915 [Asanoa ferruginea]|uniref:NQR2/RnfD/RnfE family subunit of NADH-ubiquinone oxidoreductase n=1 Tax=Asanoa ferruginea TaxID=53367 RepID=A0A3D9ZYJ0_9ACTN|nr:enediyne biosynthesis protein UnbU [Asanoa ferruginea]REF98890.1 hypothetical protein DFJ67_4915 [Asanoa ferruginea]GIF46428.1 hypothetical protein Afe04nite_09670 [Asanoa ferruginea]